jgi:hypothetical protein
LTDRSAETKTAADPLCPQLQHGPARACRARKLSGHSARKTDEFNACAVAIAARYNRGLRVQLHNVSAVLGLLVERRWQLVSQRQRTICQLHALLTAMVAAGAKGHPSDQQEGSCAAAHHPVGDVVTLERKLLARELIDDVRRLDRRIPPARRRLAEALTAYGRGRGRSSSGTGTGSSNCRSTVTATRSRRRR